MPLFSAVPTQLGIFSVKELYVITKTLFCHGVVVAQHLFLIFLPLYMMGAARVQRCFDLL